MRRVQSSASRRVSDRLCGCWSQLEDLCRFYRVPHCTTRHVKNEIVLPIFFFLSVLCCFCSTKRQPFSVVSYDVPLSRLLVGPFYQVRTIWSQYLLRSCWHCTPTQYIAARRWEAARFLTVRLFTLAQPLVASRTPNVPVDSSMHVLPRINSRILWATYCVCACTAWCR